MRFHWNQAAAQPAMANQLASALRVPPLMAQCLLNRGFDQPAAIQAFLEPRLKRLADPFLLPDMTAAVERLFRAHSQQESLVIFGDYDVDGVTSTTLLLEVLRPLGWKVNWYLPHRLEEGYGLSREGVENCLAKHPASLLLAVDCGSTSRETITALRQRGVDVIVLDHHQLTQPAPPACALVNPLSGQSTMDLPREPRTGAGPDGSVPFSELCSAGLAFKLAHAVVKRGRETGLPGAAAFDLRPLLDLVALGTIADLVPLVGENRILVSAGLAWLDQTQRPGIVALKQVAQTPAPVGTYEVGYQLAPRLNAAGRLETAEASLRLLLTRNLREARAWAEELDAHNRERQRIERTMAEEAIRAVQAKFDPTRDFAIVEGQTPWHVGVVGIVASRVLQQFYRPTVIVGGSDNGEWRGSGRSVVGFDLAAALRECDDLLLRHGGHAMAAGVSLKADQLDAFRERLNEIARRRLKPEALQAPLRLDAEVRLGDLALDTLDCLEQLRPTGQGNPPVHFWTRGLSHQRPFQRLGAERQHVKMWVTDGISTQEAVWWNANQEQLPSNRFDLAFAPQINEYNGRRLVQLKVLDWRSS